MLQCAAVPPPWEVSISTSKLRASVMVLYGLPYLPLSASLVPLGLYLPAFYSSELGFNLAIFGLLFSLSGVTAVLADPAVGVISDRFTTRFGRRKPLIAIGTPLLMLSLWEVFRPGTGATYTTVFLWMCLLYVAYSLVDIPYE